MLPRRLLLSLQSPLSPGRDDWEKPTGHLQLQRKARAHPEGCGAYYLIKYQFVYREQLLLEYRFQFRGMGTKSRSDGSSQSATAFERLAEDQSRRPSLSR